MVGEKGGVLVWNNRRESARSAGGEDFREQNGKARGVRAITIVSKAEPLWSPPRRRLQDASAPGPLYATHTWWWQAVSGVDLSAALAYAETASVTLYLPSAPPWRTVNELSWLQTVTDITDSGPELWH